MSKNRRKKVTFAPPRGDQFLIVLRRRVDDFLKQEGLSRHANWHTHLKVCLHFGVAFVLYYSIIMQLFNPWILLPMSMMLGVTSGFIGINLCHDCLHGAYSSSPRLNHLLGYAYDLVGLSSLVWKMTHNGGHHTYTNIIGLDPDIDKPVLLRLSPNAEHYSLHRYQHWYIWFLYGLVGINWIYYADYSIVWQERSHLSRRELLLFFFFKMVNFIIFLIIPFSVMTLPWWQIFLGYLGYQIAGGFAVALIFQLAHIVEATEFPTPNNGAIDSHWGAHEMRTTANFGTANPILNYLVGGLNFQVEHHLMPYISHVHYKRIAPIVKATAQEYGLPYHENRSMLSAIASHWRLLRALGKGRIHSVKKAEPELFH